MVNSLINSDATREARHGYMREAAGDVLAGSQKSGRVAAAGRGRYYDGRMALTREEVLHVAKLARVGLTDDDVTKFQGQLSQILEHFTALSSIDTADVPPTTHSLPLENVMAPDEPEPSLTQAEVLANAPLEYEHHLRVKAVLEE